MSIRKKVLIPMIVLTVICSAAVLGLSLFLFAREFNRYMFEKVDVAVETVQHELEVFEMQSRMAATIMAESREFVSALEEGSREKLLSVAGYLIEQSVDVDFCTIFDTDGIVLARTHLPDMYGDDLSQQTSIKYAQQGEKTTSFEEGTVTRLAVRTVIPVYNEHNHFIGIVSIGYRLDNNDFVEKIKYVTGCEASIFIGDERISTTVVDDEGKYAVGLTADPAVSDTVLSGGIYINKIEIMGRQALAEYFPLFDIYGNPIGMFCVGMYTSDETLRITFFVISAVLITLAVLIVAFIFAAYISKTIDRQLTVLMDDVRESDKKASALANFEHILNGVDAMICVTDPETDELLFINDIMKGVFNVHSDYKGRTCYDVLHKISKRCDYCPLDQLTADPDSEIIWEQFRESNGRTYRCYSRYFKWPNGKYVHIQHSVDITDMKEAERVIAEKNELNQLLFNNAPIGLTIYDVDFKFIDCNETILEMFDVTKEQYANFFGSISHSPEKQPDGSNSMQKALELTRRVIENDEYIKTEWIHLRPDGELLPVELTMMRSIRENKYVGLCYMYDMREQSKLKEDLKTALINAEAANKAKSTFLANMSHEIRTPMNAILGITEIQLRNESLSAEIEHGLERIYDSGHVLLNIVNDILDLSKIEAGMLEIIPVKYDLPSLINDAVQLNRLRYDSKPIKFLLEADPNIPQFLYGDEIRIKQILNNILSNALKYTDKGEVKLTVHADRRDGSENTALNPGDTVTLVFTVSDTGQGMTKEELSKLFHAYTRFNLEINRTTVGTGLGMNITKHILDLMDGDISVTSEVGVGSTFTVHIPQVCTDSRVCGEEITDKLRNFTFRNTSITKKSRILYEPMPYGSVLVVDDVESNIYVTRGLLLPYGLKIDTASGGLEAIGKIKAGNVYDIIFMDHMMPKIDGIEAAKQIRALGYKNAIVALTANALIGHAEMFLEQGFTGYLSKPIDSRELNHILNDCIRNKKPPEVVKAARRRQRADNGKTGYTINRDSAELSEIEKMFMLDAESAITVLEGLYKSPGELDNAGIGTYEITLHGMKSAFLNIGETKLSDFAKTLEDASKEKNLKLMAEQTPQFIDALKELIALLKAKEK